MRAKFLKESDEPMSTIWPMETAPEILPPLRTDKLEPK
jgi:hypothetical protein